MTALMTKARALDDTFAHREDVMENAQARRDALFGLWAAATMRRNDTHGHQRALTTADVADPDGVFARVRHDFDATDVTLRDDEIRNRMVSMLNDVADEMSRAR